MNIEHILFLDIETVAGTKCYDDLSERMQQLWAKKASFLLRKESFGQNPNDLTAGELYERAGIYAEFGKIVSIALGFFKRDDGELQLRIKDISLHDEKALLEEFKSLLEGSFANPKGFPGKGIPSDNFKTLRLCAHNGKEFDFPYIARRMIVNGIKLPNCLNLAGKKPWEIPHIDTMDLWKFGDYKNFTSLDLLAAILDIPTSKDDIDGSQVNEVYYRQNDLERIGHYCKKDVAVLAQVYLKLVQAEPIRQDQIVIL